MTVHVKLPAEFKNIYINIFRLNPEESTIKLVINELHKRLAEYKLMDKMFQERYEMDFEEFKRRRVVEESGYSFNVEEDYCDWELSSDGIETITAELSKLAKYS
jgi:hypothetical protein